jgi:peptidase M50-like protein
MSEAFWVFLGSFFGLYVLGLFIAIVAHEGGHLLCARICSIPISAMIIGCGPVLLRGRVGNVQVELRPFPVGGLVIPAALPNLEKRGPMALYFLGGILGNFAVIGAIILLHIAGAVPTVLFDQAGMPIVELQAGVLVGMQLLVIILSLLPFRGAFKGVRIASDGVQLLRVFSGKFPYAVLLAPYSHGTTRLSMKSPALSRIAFQLARADRWSSEDARRDFCSALRRELAEGRLSAEEEMLVLDALVTDGLLFADPALRSELDQWSLRALQLGPEVRTLVGSRGAALVETGRYQEGKALLETVAFADDIRPFDALMSRIFLARAEHALGNSTAAAGLMTQVRSETAKPGAVGPATMTLIERIESDMKIVP